MVIVKVIGGLGNQLFQYSFGRAIEIKTGMKVYYDVEDFEAKYKIRKNSLTYFNVNLVEADPIEVKRWQSFSNKLLYKIYNYTNGIAVKRSQLHYYAEKDLLFDKSIFNFIHDNLYLNGYWQSELYFKDISEVIRSEIKVLTLPSGGNAKIFENIQTSNSVSIHVRRGDYLTNSAAKKIYPTCSIEYYKKAINYLTQRINSPTFFVFSDDINWAKDNLKCDQQLVFVDQNSGDMAFEDLRLMSACKHNIIANSTFSWWGGWLNSSAEKMVIAPEKWFNEGHYKYSDKDLIPDSWIRL